MIAIFHTTHDTIPAPAPGETIRPAGVWHRRGCPHHDAGHGDCTVDRDAAALGTDCGPACALTYYVDRYPGQVLDLVERNYHDDSDFLAVVYAGEAADGAIMTREVGYATTRAWTARNHATVDAPAELAARYHAQRAARYHERRAPQPTHRRGDRVQADGRRGHVIWVGRSRYSRAPRIGVRWDSGEVTWGSPTAVSPV